MRILLTCLRNDGMKHTVKFKNVFSSARFRKQTLLGRCTFAFLPSQASKWETLGKTESQLEGKTSTCRQSVNLKGHLSPLRGMKRQSCEKSVKEGQALNEELTFLATSASLPVEERHSKCEAGASILLEPSWSVPHSHLRSLAPSLILRQQKPGYGIWLEMSFKSNLDSSDR